MFANFLTAIPTGAAMNFIPTRLTISNLPRRQSQRRNLAMMT